MLKSLLAATAVAASGILFTGCGTPQYAARAAAPAEMEAHADAGLPDGDRYLTAAPDAPTAAPKRYSPVDDPMITLSASLDLGTADVGKVQLDLMTLAKQHNGYLLNSTPEETSIRVEQGRFMEAVAAAEKLGKVLDKRIYGRSMEEQFQGQAEMIRLLEETRTRLSNEIRKSDSPNERQNLERQLQEVEQRLLAVKGAQGGVKRQVHYATLTVNHHKKQLMGPVTAVFWAAGKGLRWLFVID